MLFEITTKHKSCNPTGEGNRTGVRENVRANGEWTEVNRKRKAKGNKIPIVLVGDSMLRDMNRIVRCNEEGSGCHAMSGAGIRQIIEKAVVKAGEMEEGLLVVEGGGNSLGHIGDKVTADVITDGVTRIRNMKKKLKL